jgi:hypothetical protein
MVLQRMEKQLNHDVEGHITLNKSYGPRDFKQDFNAYRCASARLL